MNNFKHEHPHFADEDEKIDWWGIGHNMVMGAAVICFMLMVTAICILIK